MTIGCNIWMICLKLNWFFYSRSRILRFSQFVWALRSSVWDVFNNFLLIDATDRSKISSDQKRFFIALSLYLLSFFANTPFKRKPNYEICWFYNWPMIISNFTLSKFHSNIYSILFACNTCFTSDYLKVPSLQL